jgi:hypothetical protein
MGMGVGGEMTQTLYAHMKKKKKLEEHISQILFIRYLP